MKWLKGLAPEEEIALAVLAAMVVLLTLACLL